MAPTPSTGLYNDSSQKGNDAIDAQHGQLVLSQQLREASDAIAVRRVNSDAAFRTTFPGFGDLRSSRSVASFLHGSSTHVLVQSWRRVVADSLHRKTKKTHKNLRIYASRVKI